MDELDTLLKLISDALTYCLELEETIPECVAVREHLRNAMAEVFWMKGIPPDLRVLEILLGLAEEAQKMEKPASKEETVKCVYCGEKIPLKDALSDKDGDWVCPSCYGEEETEEKEETEEGEETEGEEEIRKR